MVHRQVLSLLLTLMVSVIIFTTSARSDETTAGAGVVNEVGKMNGKDVNMIESAQKSGIESITWITYVNSDYRFRINYPNTFVNKSRKVAKLANFIPVPVASIFFMNPTMAKGGLAGIEPPDLEVRIYRTGDEDSLKSWLVSAGFASADSGTVSRPYRHIDINGLEVCQSTMIAPGCSIYVLGGIYVYQLTAMSQNGVDMIKTFHLEP